jgi:hypothetical protein
MTGGVSVNGRHISVNGVKISTVALSRREFVASAFASSCAIALREIPLIAGLQDRSGARALYARFPDLPRHFVFEYYGWYGMNPVDHWDQDGRRPPVDLASNFMPRLGAYDSKSRKVIEQHARWIRESRAGAVNFSWWGPGSDTDKLVPAFMDVMAAHDIKVTLHLEPYRDHHALYYAENIAYLIRRYGEQRRWDCFLLLQNEDGTRGPVFKSFRTILPSTVEDCHGRMAKVRDYADDAVWRTQTDRVRATFAKDFDRVTLLADSLDVYRTKQSGFDGIAIYDNYVKPSTWRAHADACREHDLLFSFNVNPGFDGIVRRDVPADSCYVAPSLEPLDRVFDWKQRSSREAAARAAEARIRESFATTVALQTDPTLTNFRRGFFLTYLNSFNEWHEGHQFEPMEDASDLSRDERGVGYHNPQDGEHRFTTLKKVLATVVPRR